MTHYEEIDMFNDMSLIEDPYPYYEHLRAQGPAVYLPQHNVVAVTGYREGLPLFSNPEIFSAANAVTGPFPPLPFTPEGDDITEQLAAHREELSHSGLIMTEDPPQHAKTKSLLMGMITPIRLKENETFMWELADQLIDEFIERGSFEAIMDYGQPYATLVIADLLGVPEEDHKNFRMLRSNLPGQVGGEKEAVRDPLEQIGLQFYGYIEERRQNPRDDVLGKMAQVKYRDGTTPSVIDVVKTATFMFGAGQHTTVLLLASALRILGEDPELQAQLRADRSLIPKFIEEVLRLQSPVKGDYRLVTKTTKIGDLEVKAGTTVMLLLAAMNRDPAVFEDPHSIRLDRTNAGEQVAFGRGVHACAGSPLARGEAKVSLERLFDRLADIRINEAAHGPAGQRRFEYEPTYTLRGLKELHLDFTRA
ncbi:cytochrome P450 [Mangrovimicrobium sediminis]|uniref:Cytochrome P450 n=1 Tax=Mangrovimicrobium sediminis TaxID=2562682 RepID=A0A4Z0M1T8_9GAMM|nr:cytochrome P450 [Haliea sp. SAOS-164]TGD73406.1 cytochrome P450 [Haliea sp. SAOS-164]